MIIKKENRTNITEKQSQNGAGELKLDILMSECKNAKNIVTFAKASLEKGASVGYHEHFDESEIYYILKGKALYNDNGTEIEIIKDDITFTPSGEGHGIKNIGDTPLEFIALTVLD